MLSDISDTQVQLGEEYNLSSEQILVENEMIFKSLGEIKRKLEDVDARLTSLEQQLKHVTFTSSQNDLPDSYLGEQNNSDTVLEKPIKKEKQRSTCFSCSWENKHCTLYFEDLYDFDKGEININIGADLNRLRCRCGHLIRIHEFHPSNSSQINLLLNISFHYF
jgi:hypothetical protein